MLINLADARQARAARLHPPTYSDALRSLRTLLRVHGFTCDIDLHAALQPALAVIVDRIDRLAPSPDRAEADMQRIVARQDRRWMRDLYRRAQSAVL
jgi:hypothetical protein